MEKKKIIKKIVSSFKEELKDMSYEKSFVETIYKIKIDEEFCSNFGITAPLSSFGKAGPHIFVKANNKIGFGMYIKDLSFNKGLYEQGAKFWAEILSPDFFLIFSDNIKEEEISNSLFQLKKDILLSAFGQDYSKNKIKQIPIIIYEIKDNYSKIRLFESNASLLKILTEDKELIDLKEEKEKVNKETLFYIAGNTYQSSPKELVFSNYRKQKSGIENSVLDLKFFNNIRDLERKLSVNNKPITERLSIETNNDDFLFPDIRLNINKSYSKDKYIDKEDLTSALPILKKSFLKGFFDRQFIYKSEDLYSGEACIKKSSIDETIRSLITDLNGKVLSKEIKVDNSFLEVRRMPFCSGRFTLI